METIPYLLLICTILGVNAGRIVSQRGATYITISLCSAALGLAILDGAKPWAGW